VLRGHGVGTLGAVALLITCVGLMQIAFTWYQPLLVLRLVEFMQSGVSAVTGLAFGISGLAAAGAAVLYPRLAQRFGYVSVVTGAALLETVAYLVTGIVPSVAVIVAAAGAAGLFYGVISPALSSMLGLEAPVAVQARIFGAWASSTAIGFGLGPLLGGGAAATLGVSTALMLGGVFPVLLAVILVARGREPVR
jgi:MFS family permease